MEAADRRRLIETFWERVTAGVPDPTGSVARLRAVGVPDLPDDATRAQLDAWLELAELAADEDFVATTRANALWLWRATEGRFDPVRWQRMVDDVRTLAVRAIDSGTDPESDAAARVVERLFAGAAASLGRRDGPAFRRWLTGRLRVHTDPRAERYWRLVAIIRGVEWSDETHTARRLWSWVLAAIAAHAPTHPSCPSGDQRSGGPRVS
jgi:hypothetical protein